MSNVFKFFKPLTPSLRHTCLINKNIFWKKNKINSLSYTKKYLCGRNKFGNLILYTKSKKKNNKIKIIDNHFINYNIPGIYCRFEYDSKRSCFVSLVQFKNGLFCYINAIDSLYSGSFFYSYPLFSIRKQFSMSIGDRSYIYNIPTNSIISNIEDFFFLVQNIVELLVHMHY